MLRVGLGSSGVRLGLEVVFLVRHGCCRERERELRVQTEIESFRENEEEEEEEEERDFGGREFIYRNG